MQTQGAQGCNAFKSQITEIELMESSTDRLCDGLLLMREKRLQYTGLVAETIVQLA